jgi:hypothetical protein
MSLKIENSRRVAESRPVCMGLYSFILYSCSPTVSTFTTHITVSLSDHLHVIPTRQMWLDHFSSPYSVQSSTQN